MSVLLASAMENYVRTASSGNSLYLLSMTSVANAHKAQIPWLQDQGPVSLLPQTGDSSSVPVGMVRPWAGRIYLPFVIWPGMWHITLPRLAVAPRQESLLETEGGR